MKSIILVGARVPESSVPNPGGQLTASIGLIEHAEKLGYSVKVIDTTQSSFPVPPLKARLKRGWQRVVELFSSLSSDNVQGVIIFSSSGMSFYERIVLSMICRLRKVPDVFFMRSGHFMNQVNKSKFYRIIASTFLKVPQNIGAQGEDWKLFYSSIGVKESKVFVVRNWLSASFPTLTVPKKAEDKLIRFVFVGWMVKEKGVTQLLSAISELSKEFTFHVDLVGGGTLEGYCSDYVVNNQLQDYVTLHGWQDKDYVVETYKNSHVFILPSEAEGFPNSFLEALALGLPAICTNVGGVSDSLINGENGHLLANNSSESIYNAMKSYIEKPELVECYSQAAIEVYKQNHSRYENCSILLNRIIGDS
ncbi:glycosyltransferase [Pleionea sp. CnH1-48]|uniref:glycosyltransferase n=1 Tax=Pleionea sp. CnH1-48 TaxID=2954494 RepID=UPI00209793B5|nr:glycosyltransferase [Pleionea sp. CnH1-48]MCO7223790.1 glycosyltransferase [Pleionea sp. CnH1-48]